MYTWRFYRHIPPNSVIGVGCLLSVLLPFSSSLGISLVAVDTRAAFLAHNSHGSFCVNIDCWAEERAVGARFCGL